VLDFAVGTVGLGRVVSGHATDNPASGRILRKLGFRWTGDATVWSRSRQAEITTRKYRLDAGR
jgi:RimJ/RimL family protein N-acetyltransferase